MPPLGALVMFQLVGFAAVAIAVLAVRPPWLPGGAAVDAVLGGIAGAAGLAAFYRGMSVGAMAIVAPISALAACVPLGVGLARGERPSTLQDAGVALALAGVLLAAREKSAGRSRMAAGLSFALIAAGCFGLALVALAAASRRGHELSAVFVFRATGAAVVTAAALVVRPDLRGARRLAWPLLGAGVLDVGANELFAIAVTRGLVSVISVLSSLYPVTTVALAAIVLRERISRVQQIGVAVALAGVALVSAG